MQAVGFPDSPARSNSYCAPGAAGSTDAFATVAGVRPGIRGRRRDGGLWGRGAGRRPRVGDEREAEARDEDEKAQVEKEAEG